MVTGVAQVKKVIVFTTPTCSYCNTAKRYLREKGIKFKEIDVSRNQKAAQESNKIMKKANEQSEKIMSNAHKRVDNL